MENLTRAERRRLARDGWKALCRKRGLRRGTDEAPSLGLVAQAIAQNKGLVKT